MLLRRIIEHVKTQNWTAVGLDFIIVVVGVFIGIQVANWNGTRQNLRAEARYIVDLANDVRADIAELEAVQQNAIRNASLWHVILTEGFGVSSETLGPYPPYDRAALPDFPSAAWNNLFAGLFSINTFDPSTQTFDMLISTGDITLMRDHEFVRSFMAYQKTANEHQDFKNNTVSVRTALAPSLIEWGFALGFPIDVERMARTYRDDAGVVSALITIANLERFRIARAQSTHGQAVVLLEMIEGE